MIPTKRLTARLGISQYDVKAPLSTKEIIVEEVMLPLSQHIGAPAKAIVQVGDKVTKGDLIGVIPEGAVVGANLHASISGQIIRVDTSIGIRAV